MNPIKRFFAILPSLFGSTDCMVPSLLSISLICGCIPSMTCDSFGNAIPWGVVTPLTGLLLSDKTFIVFLICLSMYKFLLLLQVFEKLGMLVLLMMECLKETRNLIIGIQTPNPIRHLQVRPSSGRLACELRPSQRHIGPGFTFGIFLR